MSKTTGRSRRQASGEARAEAVSRANEPLGVYELEVCLIGGLLTEEFVKANPVVSRTIQIRGDQTLFDLHDCIFDAFDRFDEHLHEFQVGGKRPMDRKARRYVLPLAEEGLWGEEDAAGRVDETTLAGLQLKKGARFYYWFDFGDDWWHQIKVLAIRDAEGGQRYPKVVAKVGASPPQYPGLDDDDDEGELEDE